MVVRQITSRRFFLNVAATVASGFFMTVAACSLSIDDLSSERGVDYTGLRDMMKAGKWREADEETLQLMLRAVGKSPTDIIRSEDYRTFPCTDLQTIDRLWVTYSQGQFGLSVQKRIYVETGNPVDGQLLVRHRENYNQFAERVGWLLDGDIVDYKDLDADPSISPTGELPGFVSFGDTWNAFWTREPRMRLIAQRLTDCSR